MYETKQNAKMYRHFLSTYVVSFKLFSNFENDVNYMLKVYVVVLTH